MRSTRKCAAGASPCGSPRYPLSHTGITAPENPIHDRPRVMAQTPTTIDHPRRTHDDELHAGSRMDQHRGPGNRHRRHHAPCAGRIGRRGVRRSACDRQPHQQGGRRRRGRVGESGRGPVHAGERRSRRSQRSVARRSGPGQHRSDGPRLVLQSPHHRHGRVRAVDGRPGVRRSGEERLSMSGREIPPRKATVSPSARSPLVDLENAAEFIARHIGITPDNERHMLSVVGAASRRALIEAVVPRSIARSRPMALPPVMSEAQALAELKHIAAQNKVLKSCIGQGYHGTHTPGVILRNVLENPAWYTAYTPYQAEISQGRLEALVNFQTMVCDLTGMAIAGASMLDEATAAAEAMTLAMRVGKSNSTTFFVADDVLPQTLEVVQTRARPLGIAVVTGDADAAGNTDAFAVLLQFPGVDGVVRDLKPICDAVHARGRLVIVAADLLALALITPPGEMDADIAIGNTQRFGMPMGNGAPQSAHLATPHALEPSISGRLTGVRIHTTRGTDSPLGLRSRRS